jgi:hypothetical protein
LIRVFGLAGGPVEDGVGERWPFFYFGGIYEKGKENKR